VSWADHDHRGDYADTRHEHYDYAGLHHRHYDEESAIERLKVTVRDAMDRISDLEAQAAEDQRHAREIEENLLNTAGRLAAAESALARLRDVLDALAAGHEAVWRQGTAGEPALTTAWDFRNAFGDMSAALAGNGREGD
jgi:DNA polymerase III delta prime subunit